MKNLAIAVVTAISISACSTSYKATGLTGGYSELPLAKDVYEVSFRGNGYTSGEKTRDLALLRSAELVQSKGYPYFMIVNGATDVRSREVEWLGGQTNTMVTSYGGTMNAYTTYTPPTTSVESRYNTKLIVKGFTQQNTPSNALLANEVINSIKAKYKIK